MSPPIIRINSGSLRIGSGTFGIQGPPDPVIPQQANILHHFAMTDISTLFQNSGGTTPVDTDADPVNFIENIGTSGKDVIQTGGDIRAPTWNASAGLAECAQVVPGNGKTVANTNLGASVLESAFSMAILGYEITAWQNLSTILFFIDGHSGPTRNWSVINVQTLSPGESTVWSVAMGVANAGRIEFPVQPQALNTNYSMIAWGNDSDQQKAWSSTQAAPITDTATSGGHIGQNRQMTLFAGSSTGSNGIRGRIREIIFWSGYQLTDDDVASLKAYDTLTYGTVWPT